MHSCTFLTFQCTPYIHFIMLYLSFCVILMGIILYFLIYFLFSLLPVSLQLFGILSPRLVVISCLYTCFIFFFHFYLSVSLYWEFLPYLDVGHFNMVLISIILFLHGHFVYSNVLYHILFTLFSLLHCCHAIKLLHDLFSFFIYAWFCHNGPLYRGQFLCVSYFTLAYVEVIILLSCINHIHDIFSFFNCVCFGLNDYFMYMACLWIFFSFFNISMWEILGWGHSFKHLLISFFIYAWFWRNSIFRRKLRLTWVAFPASLF